MRNSRLLFLFFSLSLSFLLGQSHLSAQTASYEYQVFLKNADNGTTKPIGGLYGHFFSFAEAEAAYNDIYKGTRPKNDYSFDEKEVKDYRNKYALEGTNNGVFTFVGANGMGLIFNVQKTNEILLIKHADGNWSGKRGTTSEGNSFSYSCKKTGDASYLYVIEITTSHEIENVDVTGNYRGGGNSRKAFDFNDGYEHWVVHLELPAGTHEEDSRIIVLPYAVDCLTEDTIDYLAPAVYEGAKYHALQDKRKGFSYAEHDPLGMAREMNRHFVKRDTFHYVDTVVRAKLDSRGRTMYDENDSLIKETKYIPRDSIAIHEWDEKTFSKGYIRSIESMIHRDGKIYLDTVIDYKKPKKDGRYRGVLKVSIEDYHHQYYEVVDPGTCLRYTPYKFLQMGAAAVDLALTDEFEENSAELPINDKKELRMQFVYGKADIIEDSLLGVDIATLEKAIYELRSTGGNILSATLEAYASPDGREQTNKDLATRRANAARQRLKQTGLGNITMDIKPQIDTWEETARRLDENMYVQEAQMIRDVLTRTTGTYNAFVEIQKYPTYKEVIKPVLETQCRINFSYSFYTKKKLNATEAVEAYYQNKHDIKFSNGDYYNMFSELKDSAELDTLTEIVYNRLKRMDAYDRPLATYVYNRMALLSLKRSQPDSTILQPYINEGLKPFRLNYTKQDMGGTRNDFKQNRPEILLNQAIIFYQLQEEGRAKWFVDMLRDAGYSSPELTKLTHYINFRKLYQTTNRTPAEEAQFQEALKFVEKSGPDNRAVLYTEFEDLHKRDLAWQYVHMMRDDNPVKWYLFGLLWSTRDGKDAAEHPLSDPIELDDSYTDSVDSKSVIPADVDMSVDVRGYPYYMAYFEKSFELDKKFMRHYFNEGNISEEMRKKRLHAYKYDRVPVYKKIIALRKIDDDKELEKFKELMEGSKKKDEQKADDTTTPNTDATNPNTDTTAPNTDATAPATENGQNASEQKESENAKNENDASASEKQ